MAYRVAREICVLATLLAAPLPALLGSTASAASPKNNSPQTRTANIQQLQKEIDSLQQEVATLKTQQKKQWDSRFTTQQVHAIVESVLNNAQQKAKVLQRQATAGYDHGFFIAAPDNLFRLRIRGYIQAGYTFASSTAGNAQNINVNGNPIGPPAVGDTNKLTLRRARLIFSGYIVQPQLIYEISGDFAGSTNTNGYFQLKTTYGGYRFDKALVLRAGVLRVPFTFLSDYPVTGDDFGAYPLLSVPFNAERSMGLDLSGRLVSGHFSYDMQINNGSKASSTSTAVDNRFGYYVRAQWSGRRVLDFRREADFRERRHLAWMLGVGLGYEEQNSTSTAFPAPQTTLTLSGLATPDGAGYYPKIPANGAVYRATTDIHIKYEGLDASTTAFFQQYNDRPPAGASTDSFATAFGRSSLFEFAYYGEMGYFLVPRRWQIIGRAGELLTESGNRQMMEYGLGLNCYLYGSNARIQTAIIYIPDAAALSSSSTNIVSNAQNLVSFVQFQLKF